MRVVYSHKAEQWLEDAPIPLQDRIMEKMEFFAAQDNPLNFAKFINTKQMYRFRIGDYRALFIIKDLIIKVILIERRDKAYD